MKELQATLLRFRLTVRQSDSGISLLLSLIAHAPHRHLHIRIKTTTGLHSDRFLLLRHMKSTFWKSLGHRFIGPDGLVGRCPRVTLRLSAVLSAQPHELNQDDP
jgi:hypothetical protein